MATVTSLARIQPVAPLGRAGMRTSQPPERCPITRNTSGAPRLFGLRRLQVRVPAGFTARTTDRRADATRLAPAGTDTAATGAAVAGPTLNGATPRGAAERMAGPACPA